MLNLDRLTTPNDKLDCFVDCYREIVETLSLCSSKSECIGADDSLPVLLYVLLKATQNKLYSHIKSIYFYLFYGNFFFFYNSFVSMFKNRSEKLYAQEGYAFSQFKLAILFLETLDHKALKMSEFEFEKLA